MSHQPYQYLSPLTLDVLKVETGLLILHFQRIAAKHRQHGEMRSARALERRIEDLERARAEFVW